MSHCLRLGWLVGALCVVFGVRSSLAVVNGVLVPDNDRRFDAVGLFFTAWLGVDGCGGGVSGSCVLIAPDRIMLARHSLGLQPTQPIPSPLQYSYRARFRRTADGDSYTRSMFNFNLCHGRYQEIEVVRFIDAPQPNADVVIGVLARPVDFVRPIGIELDNPPRRAGAQIVLAGWGYSGPCFQTGEYWGLRSARGVIPDNGGVSDFLVFSPCVLNTNQPCTICPPGGPYVLANLHDSGAGVFIEVPSTDPQTTQPELRLVGIVSTPSLARRPSIWNSYGGTPRVTQAAPLRNTVIDFNRDGLVDIDDIVEYVNTFVEQAPIGDVTNDGAVTMDDLSLFISTFFSASR